MNERWFGPIVALVAMALAAGSLWFVASGMGGLSKDLVYYWSPTELVQHGAKAYTATVRLGGQVEPGSVKWDAKKNQLDFRMTDGTTTVPVSATGAPPQMFREGIGVVVEGDYEKDGVFHSDRVMVKHSNEYRAPTKGQAQHPPAEVYKTLVGGESS